MEKILKQSQQTQALTMKQFKHFTGTFLNEKIAKSIIVENVEYTASALNQTTAEHTAFIAFTEERLEHILSSKRAWIDGNKVAQAYLGKIEVLVTETPIEELKGTLPQFIVPDVWEFMYEVGTYLRQKTEIPIVAITGSVGKSTTRMMLDHLLQDDFNVLSNRGNHNTRFAMPLYMDKLVQSPDILDLEVSLNALNSRDKGSLTPFIQPTISLLTSIGAAHMTGVADLNAIAKVKANIFKGMAEDGVAIINQDIPTEQLELVLAVARENTTNILTYSMTDMSADLYLVSMKELKDFTEVTVSYQEELYTYYLGLASAGVVENSLGILLVLLSLGLDINQYLDRLLTFHSLPKVMETKKGTIDGKRVTIIDDSHNAAIPSMINGIVSFTNKVSYYSGKKILVLGQVADLGKHSKVLHEQLLPYINNSGADILLGYGEGMKEVVLNAGIPAQWYETLPSYLAAIKRNVTSNSLILLKGSVSGSDYKQISSLLDKELAKG